MSKETPQEASKATSKKTTSRRRRRPSNPEHEREEGAYEVVVRNQSLVLAYRRLAFAALMSMVSAVTCLLVLFLVAGKSVPPNYIPVTQDGRLLPLIPMNQPSVDDGVIGQFALDTITALNNFDYLNWQIQVNKAQNLFVPDSWQTYFQEFEATNIMRTVVERKMIVMGRPSGPVEIQNQGVGQDGVYLWRVAVPIVINYVGHNVERGSQRAPATDLSSKGVVTLYIQRVPSALAPNGIAVRAYQYQQTGN